eukprot:4441488-Lingulodinium_polyedra.AAC.1
MQNTGNAGTKRQRAELGADRTDKQTGRRQKRDGARARANRTATRDKNWPRGEKKTGPLDDRAPGQRSGIR